MRKLLILFAVLLSGSAAAAQTPVILIFGDSLSAGYGIDVDQSWPELLQERLKAQGYEHTVINASISGETTEGGAERIDAAIQRFSPSLVVLELGGNDGLRGFPPNRIRSNLETVIRKSHDAGAAVALLGIRIPPNYGARYTQAFESVFSDLAAKYELPSIDFFMDGVALNDELMQADGIHPTAEAQEVLLENAWPVIDAALSSTNK